ncbi:MAG: PAS domain S-box protein [Thermoplasmatota archaeon]
MVAPAASQQRPPRPVRPYGEGRFRLLAENSRDLLLLTDAQSSLRYVSPASRALLGRLPDSMLGHSAFEYIHADDRAILQERLGASIRAATAGPPAEFRMVRADGTTVWVEATGASLAGRDGRVEEIQVSVRDVSERRRAQDRYRLLAENSRDLVCIISREGAWRYVSPASRTLLGRDPAELEGQDAYASVHPDDRAVLRSRLFAGLAGEAPGRAPEFRMRHRDGSWVWVEGTGAPVRCEGEPMGEFQVTLRDVTERRDAIQKSEDAARRERGIYESISDAYFQLDREFRIVYMNPVAARMRVSGPPEGTYGKVLWEAFPDLKGSKYDHEYHRALRDGVPVEVVEYYPRMQKWYEARAYPSKEGLSIYFHDITERKRAEETERLAYQRSLEIASLKEINHYKTAFVNTAAHELGNPLTPIRIQLRLLRSAVTRGSLPDAARSLDTLERNAERLVHLVDDILEGARLQASRLVVTPTRMDLAAVLSECVESYRGPAATARIQLDLEAPAPLAIMADPKRVAQVLYNLLSNALKYGKPGGYARVRAEMKDGAAHVSVADDGRGISPDHLPHLFQPFSRIAAEAGPAGSGLGLYICAGIVKNHGGAIWCESAGPGQGSVFHFTLPQSVTPPQDPDARADEPAPAAGN